MSLKTRLRISIVALAAFIVIGLSGLYLNDSITLAFEGAHSRALLVANEVRDYVSERITEEIAGRRPHPANVEEFRSAAVDIVRTDPRVARELRNSRANYDAVLNIEILSGGRVLVAADPASTGASEFPVYHFEALDNRNALLNLWDLLFRREDYATSIPVSIVGSTGQDGPPVFTVKVIIRSVLLSRALEPGLYRLAAAFFSALAVAMFLGALLPNFFIGPLERLGKDIESISAEDPPAAPETGRRAESAEFAAVQSKLNLLGQQFRGARRDAKDLRRNVEQLLQRLEEAVLLFDSGGHLMMAGHSVERLLGSPAQELIGQTVDQVFTADRNAQEIADAVRGRKPWKDNLVQLKHGTSDIHALVSVERLENTSGADIGTLITLRDADTRHQLVMQLDISSRLAALGRLTSGVAHEIKNPLNAMALHLEVLRSRLTDAQPEVEVIAREIKRLDHVVKTFLNFSKPLEVKMNKLNLGALAEDTAMFVMPDAQSRRITVETACNGNAWISGDQDLIRQALLNVVMNGIEAMPGGGRLTIRTEGDDGEIAVVVSDTGAGIPPEARDKIFNLYYTTKSNGSGIGLAMTFRVVQLHGGTIDFVSEPDKGTSFRLRFPRLTGHGDEPLSRAAGSGRRI